MTLRVFPFPVVVRVGFPRFFFVGFCWLVGFIRLPNLRLFYILNGASRDTQVSMSRRIRCQARVAPAAWETHKSYQNATCSCSLACVCVWVVSIICIAFCLLGGSGAESGGAPLVSYMPLNKQYAARVSYAISAPFKAHFNKFTINFV